MNRQEVIMTIKKAGEGCGNVVAILNGEEFAAGYRQAISDMIKLFGKTKIDPNFDEEREAMLAHIKVLTEENEHLKSENDKQGATIEELLKHVDLHEVLGISKRREEMKEKQRGLSSIFQK